MFLAYEPKFYAALTFLPLVSSDQIIVSVSIDFSSSSKGDTRFYHTAFGYSRGDRNGFLDHIEDRLRENIFN